MAVFLCLKESIQKNRRKITCKDFLEIKSHFLYTHIGKRFREPLNELRMSLQNLIVRFYFDYRCRVYICNI